MQLPGVGVQRLRQLEQAFGTLEAAWSVSSDQLLALPGWGTALVDSRDAYRQQVALIPAEVPARVMLPADPAMPIALKRLPQPPAALFWQGHGTLWPVLRRQQAVAVIGTRRASQHGCCWAQRLGQVLATAGWPVISGLAEGIDAESHQACLKAGGRPVAVLGTSLDRVYPRHHCKLQQQVARSGLLLTEQGYATQVCRGHFARRNRLLIALARAVVLVECPQDSGALQAARLAWSMQKPLWVIPADADRPSAMGSNALLNQGATALLDPCQLLQVLGPGPFPQRRTVSRASRSPLLQAMGTGASLEQLMQRLNRQAGDLAQELLQLEQEGQVQALPGLCWRPRQTSAAPQAAPLS